MDSPATSATHETPSTLGTEVASLEVQANASGRRLLWASLLLSPLQCLLGSVLGGAVHALPPESALKLVLSLLSTALTLGSFLVPLLGLVLYNKARKLPGGKVTVRDNVLELQGSKGSKQWSLDPREAASRWVLGNSTLLELRRDDGNTLRLSFPTTQEADQFCHTHKLGVKHRVANYVLGRIFYDILGVLLGLPLALGIGSVCASLSPTLGAAQSLLAGALGTVLALLGGYAVQRGLTTARIQVGSDGVVVRHRFRAWFVSYADLESVAIVRDCLCFRRKDGTEQRAPIYNDYGTSLRQVLEQIEAARETYKSDGAVTARAMVLGSNGRSAAHWKEALERLAKEPASYRGTGMSDEDLVRVVEAAAYPLEQRAGAAVALLARNPEAYKARLEALANSTVQEPVRVVLKSVVGGEVDDSLVEALGKTGAKAGGA